MTCRAPDCRRKALAHHALCEAHVRALIDRVIRGKAS